MAVPVTDGGRLRTFSGLRVVATDADDQREGWVSIEDGVIAAVGYGPRPGATRLDACWLVPGFIDLHVHGGAGFGWDSRDPGAAAAIIDLHSRHGTTLMLASLVTAPLPDLLETISRIRSCVANAPTRRALHGIHLEGPFLAPSRCGAQDPTSMLIPEGGAMDALLAAGGGLVRVVTIAPELAGAMGMISHLASLGVVAAIGHSDADSSIASQAFEAGATLVTHLWNGMRPMHHRTPGVTGVALAHSSVTCELIVDGAHLHPAVVRLTFAAKGGDGVALVTDAIPATGTGDGRARLGAVEVTVTDGVPRLADRGLAGSTLTMDRALRNAVAMGIPLSAASRAASLVPARVLGLDRRLGSIAVGKQADLVVLDPELSVAGVLRAGTVVAGEELMAG